MVLILGSKGMLGGQLLKVFGNDAVGWDRSYVDVANTEDLKLKIQDLNPKPSAVINCVAYNDVDGAEINTGMASKLNTEVPGELAKICKELEIPLVHFSSNYVFDGKKGEYNEVDKPQPQSSYARSKYQGELEVANNTDQFYIVRTSVLFGPKGESELSKKSFIEIMLDLAKSQKEVKVVSDEVNSITYAVDLAGAIRVLLSQKFAFGIYHFTNLGSASWYDFAKEMFKLKNLDIKLIPVAASEFPRKAKRPKKAVLINNKFIEFRPWQEALADFLTPTP